MEGFPKLGVLTQADLPTTTEDVGKQEWLRTLLQLESSSSGGSSLLGGPFTVIRLISLPRLCRSTGPTSLQTTSEKECTESTGQQTVQPQVSQIVPAGPQRKNVSFLWPSLGSRSTSHITDISPAFPFSSLGFPYRSEETEGRAAIVPLQVNPCLQPSQTRLCKRAPSIIAIDISAVVSPRSKTYEPPHSVRRARFQIAGTLDRDSDLEWVEWVALIKLNCYHP